MISRLTVKAITKTDIALDMRLAADTAAVDKQIADNFGPFTKVVLEEDEQDEGHYHDRDENVQEAADREVDPLAQDLLVGAATSVQTRLPAFCLAAIRVGRPHHTKRHIVDFSILPLTSERTNFQKLTPTFSLLRIRYWRNFDLELADRRSRCQPRKKCPNRWRSHLLPRMRQFARINPVVHGVSAN